MPAAIEKQLANLQRQIKELRGRLALTSYVKPSGEQAQILSHFLNRALQMSEASDLVGRANLGTPLVVLMRVLCEDMFLSLWVSISEKHAAEYSDAVDAEALKFVRILLENGRGQVRHKSTHEDRTHEVMQRLKGAKTNRVPIDQLATQLGLSKVYDLVYRYPSMEVHGKAFGLLSPSEEEGIFSSLSAIVSLAESIGLIADNRVLWAPRAQRGRTWRGASASVCPQALCEIRLLPALGQGSPGVWDTAASRAALPRRNPRGSLPSATLQPRVLPGHKRNRQRSVKYSRNIRQKLRSFVKCSSGRRGRQP